MYEAERKFDYLRISVTDRCNLRCMYCMPRTGVCRVPHDKMLTFEEIVRLARIFAGIGVKKIRLTGGEPFVRKGIEHLIRYLSRVAGIEEIAVTTNGVLLPLHAEGLMRLGVRRINISLDTLNQKKFVSITGSDCLNQVLLGIKTVTDLGFYPIKLNTVIMRGINDDEITDFVRFAVANNIELRFIEFMKVTPLWKEDFHMTLAEIQDKCSKDFTMRKLEDNSTSPARYYEVDKGTRVGFIRTDEENCRNCNRLRLTSTGDLRICLYEKKGVNLKQLVATPLSDDAIAEIIMRRIGMKENINYTNYACNDSYMYNIGG